MFSNLQIHYPLWEGVIESAKSAAFSDPRFKPVESRELDEIKRKFIVKDIQFQTRTIEQFEAHKRSEIK